MSTTTKHSFVLDGDPDYYATLSLAVGNDGLGLWIEECPEVPGSCHTKTRAIPRHEAVRLLFERKFLGNVSMESLMGSFGKFETPEDFLNEIRAVLGFKSLRWFENSLASAYHWGGNPLKELRRQLQELGYDGISVRFLCADSYNNYSMEASVPILWVELDNNTGNVRLVAVLPEK